MGCERRTVKQSAERLENKGLIRICELPDGFRDSKGLFSGARAYIMSGIPSSYIAKEISGNGTVRRGVSTATAATGLSTESGACSTPTGANHLPEPKGDDPFGRICCLLQTASIQGMEDIADVRYDLPGIRLGVRNLLDREAPFSPDQVYDAVLAAVSRSV